MEVTPHLESTIQRMAKEKIVLTIHDVTSPKCEGSSSRPESNSRFKDGQDVHLQHAIVFNMEGAPLGLLHAHALSSGGDELNAAEHVRGRLEWGNGGRWYGGYRVASFIHARLPDTIVVSIGDCEAGVFDVFAGAAALRGSLKLILRVGGERKEADGECAWLRKHILAKPLQGRSPVWACRKDGACMSGTEQEIRFGAVGAHPARDIDGGASPIWYVHAGEDHPSKRSEAVELVLLSDIPVLTVEDALQIIDCYGIRRKIDHYRRTLQRGCGQKRLFPHSWRNLEKTCSSRRRGVARVPFELAAAGMLQSCQARPLREKTDD